MAIIRCHCALRYCYHVMFGVVLISQTYFAHTVFVMLVVVI